MGYRAATMMMVLILATAPDSAHAVGGSRGEREANGTDEKEVEYMRGEAAAKAGLYTRAIEHLTAQLQITPDHADAMTYLGFSYRKLGRFDEAMTWYARALRIAPDHLGAHEYLGELHLERNDLASAEQQLRLLERLCPGGCEERAELQAAIQGYRTGGRARSGKP